MWATHAFEHDKQCVGGLIMDFPVSLGHSGRVLGVLWALWWCIVGLLSCWCFFGGPAARDRTGAARNRTADLADPSPVPNHWANEASA